MKNTNKMFKKYQFPIMIIFFLCIWSSYKDLKFEKELFLFCYKLESESKAEIIFKVKNFYLILFVVDFKLLRFLKICCCCYY